MKTWRRLLYPVITISLISLLCSLPCLSQAEIVFFHPDYTFSLHESGRVAHMRISAAEYARWTNAVPTFSDRTNLTCRVYAHVQDVFDFIFVINDEDATITSTYGRSYGVRNNVSGIGRSLFDNTASYGSTGILQSLIHLTERNGLINGPSLHEILHQWANYLTSFPTENASHWGYSSIGGQLGGWQHGTLQDLGGGQYDADGPGGVTYWYPNANGGNACPYSDLELYLMGLIPTNGVTNNLVVAQGFAWTVFSQGKFSATNLLSMTIGNIVAGDGPRVPACGIAPTNFRSLVVVISASSLSNAQWASLDADVARFSANGSDGDPTLYNFWEATKGLAQMKMDGLLGLLKSGMEYVGVRETQTLDATMYRGDPPPGTDVLYTLTNSFGIAVAWTTEVTASWLSVSPAAGVLQVGGSTQVVVNIAAAATNMAGGRHSADVRFVNTSNGVATVRAASLTVYDFSELPFSDGFETGALSPYWVATGTGEWRIVVSATNGVPHSGTQHLILDDYAGSGGAFFSRNEATLGLDLYGYTNVVLTFWVFNQSDEPHGPPPSPFIGGADFDGVAISADGTNWYEVHPLRYLPATNAYIQRTVNLDAAAAARGLGYNNRFRIRFNQYDNYPFGLGDGIALDDISITGSLTDFDGDGMPDRFERKHSLNPNDSGDAAEDADGDGVSNLDEYIADTSPRDAQSVLAITTLNRTGAFTIRFESSSQRVYSLLWRDLLPTGSWTGVIGMTNQPGLGGPMELTDTNAPAAMRFYNVRCTQP